MMSSQLEEVLTKLGKYLKTKITAKLTAACGDSDVDDFNFNVSADHFADDEDPRRFRFNKDLDYNQEVDEDGNINFASEAVQTLHRNWQLSNQMHRCCFTCFKYGMTKSIMQVGILVLVLACRFYFPWTGPPQTSPTDVTICSDRDKKHRIRARAFAPRNNGNINSHSAFGYFNLAVGGNMDIQYIGNKLGAAEYISSYIGKADEADTKKIRNIVFRSFTKRLLETESIDVQTQIRVVTNAVVTSAQVGAVQVCSFLIKIKTVQSSHDVKNINPLPRQFIYKKIKISTSNNVGENNSVEYDDGDEIDELEADHMEESYKVGVEPCDEVELEGRSGSSVGKQVVLSAFEPNTIGTMLGKRDFYSLLVNQQYEKLKEMDITNDETSSPIISLFSFYTNFTVKLKGGKKNKNPPPLFTLDRDGFVVKDQQKSYLLQGMAITPLRKPDILNMSPSIPVDEANERSAYAILLLHIPWNDETKLLLPYNTAVEKLRSIIDENKLPSHVSTHTARRKFSENLTLNQGAPQYNTAFDDDGNDIPVDGFYENVPLNVGYHVPLHQNFDVDCQTLSMEDYQSYYNFIQHENQSQRDKHASAHQYVPDIGSGIVNLNNEYIFHVDDREKRMLELKERVSRMKPKQIRAFNKIAEKLNNGGFSLSFITGGGGVGKSYLVRQIMEHCLLTFGKTIGFYGPCLALGPTGCASHNIDGHTWQSALGKGLTDEPMTQSSANKVGSQMRGLRLLILDEVSMMSSKDICEIEERVKRGTFLYITYEVLHTLHTQVFFSVILYSIACILRG